VPIVDLRAIVEVGFSTSENTKDNRMFFYILNAPELSRRSM